MMAILADIQVSCRTLLIIATAILAKQIEDHLSPEQLPGSQKDIDVSKA